MHGRMIDGSRDYEEVNSATPTITWFSNPHEHSLHYVKYGFMRLADKGEIQLSEIPNRLADRAQDLPQEIRNHTHRRTVAVRISHPEKSQLVVLDGEDSIFQTSPLIQWCDLYFSCSYRKHFFENEDFDLGYTWQNENEILFYKKAYKSLQDKYAEHLHKGRPLYPIGPSMEWKEKLNFWERRLRNLRHRYSNRNAPFINWRLQYERFRKRWDRLLSLRSSPIKYDIVLKDSLWGWPQHRHNLHKKLQSLAGKYEIRSELNYSPKWGKSHPDEVHPEEGEFPIIVGGGIQDNYEKMLSESRIGVFATGFHWGCRNIVTLAWLLGLKVLSDPFIFQSWFDFEELGVEFTQSGDWSEIEEVLARFDAEAAQVERNRIQNSFDRLMGPEVAARRVIDCAIN